MLPRTDNASEADFFVVPFFGGTSQLFLKTPFSKKNYLLRANAYINELFSHLTYFKDGMEKRHIFLFSRDAENVPQEMFGTKSIMLHYGPYRLGSNEIVVPPNDAGFGYPLEPESYNRKNDIFFMAGLVNNACIASMSVFKSLQQNGSSLKMELHEIFNHRKFNLTVPQTRDMMLNSNICPVIYGDLPYQHRLYDVIAMGCIPLVLKITANGLKENKSYSCITNYLDIRKKTIEHPWGAPIINDCVEFTYPFQNRVNFSDIFIELPIEDLTREGGLKVFFDGLSKQFIEKKRKALYKMRNLFRYDWSGRCYDAFSELLNQLCIRIGKA
jgi:hypothetical protein